VKSDELLSNFAFNVKLRRYNQVGKDTAKQGEMAAECAAIEEEVPALEAGAYTRPLFCST